MQLIGFVAAAGTLNPLVWFVTVTCVAGLVLKSIQTAFLPPIGWSVYPDCGVSAAVKVVVDVPPGKSRPKLTAPVPAAVAPEGGVTTTDEVADAANVHPPAGCAPVVDPSGVLNGTTCLTTVTVPVQFPSARLRKAVPAAG